MLKEKSLVVILLILAAISSILLFRQQLVNLFITDFGKVGYYYSRQFDLPQVAWVNTDNLVNIGAKSQESAGAGLSYDFPKKKADRVILKLLFGRPYQEAGKAYEKLRRLDLSSSGIKESGYDYSCLAIGDNIIKPGKALLGKTDFSIDLKDTAGKLNKYPELAVRRIEVSVLPKEMMFLPNFSLLFTLILVPLVLFYCLGLGGSSIWRTFLYSFLSLLGLSLATYFSYDFMSKAHLFILLAVILTYYISAKVRQKPLNYLLILAAVLIFAVSLRWAEVERLSFAIPHPDAAHQSGISYRATADNMRLFSPENGFYAAKDWHEPFYPLMIKTFLFFFGSSDLHLRFVSFIFSVLAVALAYLVSRELFKNNITALLSSGLMAVNSYLIEQSALGLRLELEICFLLLLFYFCYLKRQVMPPWAWVIGSGVIGGYWLLTKSYNLPVILFIFGYSALSNKNWQGRRRFIYFILASFLAILILLPYKINVGRQQGGSFADSTRYASDFANQEFAGKPGFPRYDIKISDYYFKLHTPGQFVGYHLAGAAGIFYFLSEQIFNVINEQNHLLKIFSAEGSKGILRYPFLALKIGLVSIFFIASILACLLNPKYRILVYIIILGNFANLFLYGASVAKNVSVIQAQRTIAQVLPFVAFCLSYAIYSLYIFYRPKEGRQCS